MNISYSVAKSLIKEADILLFKRGNFPSIGWWIGKYTYSPYSHTGLATWMDCKLYCLEFREFCGSRIYPIDSYVHEYSGRISVFRAVETAVFPKIVYDQNGPKLSYDTFEFNDDVALKITNEAKQLVGQKYSYWTIWQIFKTYIPFVRLGRKIVKNGESDPKRFVCSTLVTYSYRKNFIDPVPFISDSYTTPGDLARSGLFKKMFEIS
jgi:hypothetical protein